MVTGEWEGALPGRPHERLDAWRLSMQLVKQVYELSAAFPVEERFGLSSQMRRAAVSSPSNLAEGAARNSNNEFLHFIGIARGSMAELETQLKIAAMLGWLADDHPVFEQADHVGRLLTGLYKKRKQAQ